jgi:hypothetical protein
VDKDPHLPKRSNSRRRQIQNQDPSSFYSPLPWLYSQQEHSTLQYPENSRWYWQPKLASHPWWPYVKHTIYFTHWHYIKLRTTLCQIK